MHRVRIGHFQSLQEARQFARLMRTLDTSLAKDFADVLLKQERDVHVARARIQAMKKLIDDVEQYLRDE